MSEDRIRLFIINCAVIESELDRALAPFQVTRPRTKVEEAVDEVIGSFLKQFDLRHRINAEFMSDHYKIFYMLESEIRKLINDTLVEEKGVDWWESAAPEEVRKNVSANIEKERHEGVTLRSDADIDYVNFGELGEIIKYNWDIFGGFISSKQAVEKVIRRLNMLRAVIAHNGILSEDEVLRLKLTVRDWFRLFEGE
jgi:hypothetical protein